MKYNHRLFLIGHIFFSTQPNTISLSDWMSEVSNQSALTAITIPGTCYSGSHYESINGTAKTQRRSITAQLNDGGRYLDIRLQTRDWFITAVCISTCILTKCSNL